MLFTGNQRGGAACLASHLLSPENDHVDLHEIRGFAAESLPGALQEAQALSRGTQCRQFLYSLSLNPPPRENVGIADFEAAIDRAEDTLGLTGQPRLVIFHEKEGRRHAHAVWSRINTEEMKAINIAFPKNKLMDLSRELYREHGWKMPDGFRDRAEKDPTGFSHDEHQQAKRTGRSAAEIKKLFQDAWVQADGRSAFAAALEQQGYVLARGDRRGFVALDHHGEVFAITRQTGVKARQVREKLGDPASLPSIDEAHASIEEGRLAEAKRVADERAAERKEARQEFLRRKEALLEKQRAERTAFDEQQEQRRAAEAAERQARFRTGLRGVWDRLRGEHGRIKRQNEAEAVRSEAAAQAAREQLVQAQLQERRRLAIFSLELLRTRKLEQQDRQMTNLRRDGPTIG